MSEHVDVQQAYPFAPKSSSRLRVGDFWDVPLSNGTHATGVVVAVPSESDDPLRGKPSTREFVAGLLDWCGSSRFTPELETSHALLDWGRGHITMISRDGGQVLGNLGYDFKRIRRRSHGVGSPMWVYENGLLIGPASEEEAQSLPVARTYGFDHVRLTAERVFVQRLPLAL